MANAKIITVGLLIPIIIGLCIWYEVAVWRECMADHSWWYCLRILGR